MMAWSTAIDGMAGYSRFTAACQPTDGPETAASMIGCRRSWISGAWHANRPRTVRAFQTNMLVFHK